MIGYTCPKCGKHTDEHWRGRCVKPPGLWKRLWDRIEAWFGLRDEAGERARDAHLYSEGREDEMKKPEDWP